MALWQHDGYEVDTDRDRLDLDFIHGFLTRSYWAEGIAYDLVARSVANALPFGVYHGAEQVGFARIITDQARFAYLADVFVIEEHRGRGLSKWLMACILAHPDLEGIGTWLLATWDAHSLYARYGFEPLPVPERYLVRQRMAAAAEPHKESEQREIP